MFYKCYLSSLCKALTQKHMDDSLCVREREVTVMIKSINMILNVTQLDLLMKPPERHFTRSRLGENQ